MLNIKLEKAAPMGRRKKKTGLLQRMRAGLYRLPAHVTSEDDWQDDRRHIKLSRAFAVVLGIHVVAIGGFMAYEMFRHKDPTPVASAGSRESRTKAVTEAAVPDQPKTGQRPAANVSALAPAARSGDANHDDPADEGLRHYTVGPGERLSDIATKFNVDEHLLIEKNRIGADRAFESGMKLIIPNRTLTAQKPDDAAKLLAAKESELVKSPDNPLAAKPPEEVKPAPPAKPVVTPRPVRPAPTVAAAPKPAKKDVPANDDDKPVRKAEKIRDTQVVNSEKKDPQKTSAPPAKLADAKAGMPKSDKPAQKPTQAKPDARKPDVPKLAATKPDAAKVDPNKAKGRTHLVMENETAYRIAKRYNIDVDNLLKVNHLNPQSLHAGQTLVIPAN